MTNAADGRRFAIYYAPAAESPLHRFGRACLGRDVITGADWPQLQVEGVSVARWREMTASPRMYGFHATLKPPFRLSAGRTPEALVRALEVFASTRRSFEASPLRVTRIADFLALVPIESSAELSMVAEACVRDFDEFRAPPQLEERARRKEASLSRRQQDLLDAWGYPYVLDEWRFHMTLASGLTRDEIDRLCLALDRLADSCCGGSLLVDGVCLFEQPAANTPFLLTRRFPFGDQPRG
jgi:putative phosphonate metabolism protein